MYNLGWKLLCLAEVWYWFPALRWCWGFLHSVQSYGPLQGAIIPCST